MNERDDIVRDLESRKITPSREVTPAGILLLLLALLIIPPLAGWLTYSVSTEASVEGFIEYCRDDLSQSSDDLLHNIGRLFSLLVAISAPIVPLLIPLFFSLFTSVAFTIFLIIAHYTNTRNRKLLIIISIVYGIIATIVFAFLYYPGIENKDWMFWIALFACPAIFIYFPHGYLLVFEDLV